MMIYPPITELVDKTGSRYNLVIETAKRARQLVSGAPALSDVKTTKEVTIAVNEIYEGKIEAVNTVENNVVIGDTAVISATDTENE